MKLAEFEELFRDQPRLLTAEQVAQLLRKTTKTLRNWREEGIGPAHRRHGKRGIRYEEPALLEWIARQRALEGHLRCPTCGARIVFTHESSGGAP